jgi:tubulin polyglutamylase TTLL6/13
MLKHSYNASFPSHDMVQACFELLGMDIMIDSKMKPYILEVNHSPSFHTNEQVDKEVKEALIRDTLIMMNLSGETRKKVLEDDRKRIRDRLLSKIKDQPKEINKDVNNNELPANDSDAYLDKFNSWTQQIKWEDSHLGGYRRIMPCPNEKNKYAKFFVQQNQLSVYCDTAASKRREECAKQQRELLEEKYKANKQLIQNFKKQHNLCGEDDVVKKKKVKKSKNRDFFKPTEIYENDERDRCTSMAQREYLVKTCGLLQSVSIFFACFSMESPGTFSDRILFVIKF